MIKTALNKVEQIENEINLKKFLITSQKINKKELVRLDGDEFDGANSYGFTFIFKEKILLNKHVEQLNNLKKDLRKAHKQLRTRRGHSL
jgi:hypothetical protein